MTTEVDTTDRGQFCRWTEDVSHASTLLDDVRIVYNKVWYESAPSNPGARINVSPVLVATYGQSGSVVHYLEGPAAGRPAEAESALDQLVKRAKRAHEKALAASTVMAQDMLRYALDDAQRGYLDAVEEVRQRRRQRDDAVRKALTAGARVADICARTGLSRERIYQIRDGR